VSLAFPIMVRNGSVYTTDERDMKTM